MTSAALVNASNIVENRIVHDPDSGFEPPDGQTLVEETEATGTAHIGLGWDGTVFEQPEPGVDPLDDPNFKPAPDPTIDRIDKLEAQIADLMRMIKR